MRGGGRYILYPIWTLNQYGYKYRYEGHPREAIAFAIASNWNGQLLNMHVCPSYLNRQIILLMIFKFFNPNNFQNFVSKTSYFGVSTQEPAKW